MGLPANGCRTLASLDFIRVPSPAASTMMAVLDVVIKLESPYKRRTLAGICHMAGITPSQRLLRSFAMTIKRSHSDHTEESRHYFFGSGFLEGYFQFIPIDCPDGAVAKFLVEHPLSRLQAFAVFIPFAGR